MRSFEELFEGNAQVEIVSVQGKPYMFENGRVDRDSIPEGLYTYDVRDDNDGQFWEIKPSVVVNHWGTIIGKEPVALDDDGESYECLPDAVEPEFSLEGWFTGDYVESPEEYLDRYEELKEECHE